MPEDAPEPLEVLARDQAGVISRSQVLACGRSDEWLAAQVKAGRWRRVLPGVYSVRTGPLSRPGVLWAVLLRMGRDATFSHETAAELAGLPGMDGRTTMIHVTVPADRQPVRLAGVVVHRSTRIVIARHPARTPPQTSIEETIVDLTQTAACVDEAASWLARSIGARLTTPARLAAALARRSRLRWRRNLSSALRDVAAGCHSMLELLYLRDVERAHGLPRGERQVRRTTDSGTSQYDDVVYLKYSTVVELDGRIGHPDRFRDMNRDNATIVNGRAPLRYGYDDVRHRPCPTADQVATVLQQRGWHGKPRRCTRPDCMIL